MISTIPTPACTCQPPPQPKPLPRLARPRLLPLPPLAPAAGTHHPAADGDAFWDWQWCTEQTQYFSRDGVQDMFWDEPFNLTESVQGCLDTWNITPALYWPSVQVGGRGLLACACR